MPHSKPQPGDRITMSDSFDQEWAGIVIELLSTQFTFLTDGGTIRFCFYSDDWSTEQ